MPPLNLLLKLGNRPAWSPYDIPRSVLRAWWNADDHSSTVLMTDDGAGLISSWKDRIGALAVTGTTTLRPTWASTSFNSAKAGVTFDGSGNALTSTTLTSLPTGAVEGTLWAVMQNALVAARVPVAYGGTVFRRLAIASGTGVALAGNGTATVSGVTALSVGAPHIVAAEFGATTLGMRVDGTLENTTAETLATDTTRIRLGSAVGAAIGSLYQGVLRHVFITTLLTTLQRQQLEGWSAWDRGIQSLLPSDHPFKLAPP